MPDAYQTVFVDTAPGELPPIPAHDDRFFCQRQLVKKEKKGKKTGSTRWMLCYIPWEDLNITELLALCTIDLPRPGREETNLWEVLHHGVGRKNLIRLIKGELDPQSLEINPFHAGREELSLFMQTNWKYIWSQINCDTCCWECSDVKVCECVLENWPNLSKHFRESR